MFYLCVYDFLPWDEFDRCYINVPLLWEMKDTYFGLGVSNNRLTCMHGQKTISLSYNVHLFYPYLLNDSQTIRSTMNFSKPILCRDATLRWLVWLVSFSLHHAIMRAVLLCVQRYRGNRYFTAPNTVHSDKKWICIFIQINAKRPTSGRAIC